MRVHMLEADLLTKVCRNAGNWEGQTIEWDKVNCPNCLLDKPKPEPVKLYTMLMRKGNEERVLYGHATENVMMTYGIPHLTENPEFNDGTWELVIRPYIRYTCDWSECLGNHPHEHNYCSYLTRIGE